MVARARELAEDGWRIVEIRDRLEIEFGCRVLRQSVSCWVNDALAERRRRRDREARLALRRMAKMLEMRRRGLSFRAIGQVAGILWGEELSPEQARYQLRKAGAPPRPRGRLPERQRV
jgi:hypothetical protein